MNLYITNDRIDPLLGVSMRPVDMASRVAHMTIATYDWDTIFIDLDEVIPEGVLRYVKNKARLIRVCLPATVSQHQLNLLVDLYPELAGLLRKEYMKGGSFHGILPDVWEHGTTP